MKRGSGFSVNALQRAKVKDSACLVCAAPGPCDPAHLIPRGMASDSGDPRAVVPLCRRCHRLYDTGELDLLPSLEPHWRSELAFAVERVGLMSALQRVTNERAQPASACTCRGAVDTGPCDGACWEMPA